MRLELSRQNTLARRTLLVVVEFDFFEVLVNPLLEVDEFGVRDTTNGHIYQSLD